MIKTIIFDLSEVIIAGYYGVENVVEKNTGIPAKDFLTRKAEVRTLWHDAMRGKITEDEYIGHLLEGTDWQMSAGQFKKYFRQNLNNAVSGTFEIIEKLKDNYRLVLLSDHAKEMTDYILKKHKRLKAFERIIWSYELGQIKNDSGTFDKVLEILGTPASEVLFIDDLQRNIDCAGKAGINTLLFTNADELQKQLVQMKLISVCSNEINSVC